MSEITNLDPLMLWPEKAAPGDKEENKVSLYIG